ncbi:MAG TPA: chemotaxis protein CheW [Anaeromyxobacteraceae bacterium]
MDFLRIRQKAKERAQTREREATPPAGELAPERVQRIEDALREELAALVVTKVEAPPAVLGSRAPVEDDPLDDFFWREDEVAPSLPVLVAAPSRAAPEIAEARREWLTFVLGGEEYAVEIGHVREILKAPAITEVPRAPAHVLGVIMVRGEVIAVYDPRRRLGLPTPPAKRQARVVVCDAGEGLRGLLVDAVSQVVRLPASAIEARPSGIGGPSADYIASIGREGERLFILLDLAAVLRDALPDAP